MFKKKKINPIEFLVYEGYSIHPLYVDPTD
ncbi:hypothetical protein IIO_06413 [Bacillus cereus VD115]|nr:hypothetical protein IIO_06413 [Bacillus cereus VD115]